MFKLIEARELREGDWIRNGRLSPFRVVEVHDRADGQILVRHDFGSGGETATSIHRPNETIALS